MTTLLKLMADAPARVLQDCYFRLATETCKQLFSAAASTTAKADVPQVAATFDDWNRPDWDEWLENAVVACKEAQEIIQLRNDIARTKIHADNEKGLNIQNIIYQVNV